jgi:hypothetical protein
MKILDTNRITDWKIATKVRPIKAKNINDIIVDFSIIKKLLLDTLEGKEPLRKDAMICIGEGGDCWQQSLEKLNKKYDIKETDDNNGWSIYYPKPENEVECAEITLKIIESQFENNNNNQILNFCIIGNWGETIDGIKNIQKGEVNDYVCRNRNDNSDVWIVRKSFFENTYKIKNI